MSRAATTRFEVTYRLTASDEAQARARARGIALEQTVEIPDDLVPPGFIADEVVGRIERLAPATDGHWDVVISYLADCGGDVAQWLNVVFGNSSLQTGIRVVDVVPGEGCADFLPGPRFGIRHLRTLVRRPTGGLICSVIKPMGLGPEALAQLAFDMALAGVDIVKDDHGLANQRFAPFEPRVSLCTQAVQRANAITGGATIFAANVTAPIEHLERRARFAANNGAGALMVLPGLVGLDAVRRLATHESVSLPILAHPALLGGHLVAPDTGFSHDVLLGKLLRLLGADISIFPNVGGRFGFSESECRAIARACHDDGLPVLRTFPAPGGGMTLDRLPAIRAMYGPDVVCLLGGSLLRARDRMGETIVSMREALDRPVH